MISKNNQSLRTFFVLYSTAAQTLTVFAIVHIKETEPAQKIVLCLTKPLTLSHLLNLYSSI